MGAVVFKNVTLERLYGPSLRKQEDQILAAEGRALITAAREQKRIDRRARKARRRQNRSTEIGWLAFRTVEPGDADYVGCPEGRTRIRLAEDDQGEILYPRDLTSGWYEQLRWWKPLHWAGWLMTYRTGEVVMVEADW